MEQENALPQAGAWVLGVPYKRRYSHAEWECLYQDGISYPIAEILVHDGDSKTYHHDTLIKAAPDMYHALQKLVGVLDDCRRGTDEGNIPPGILDRFDEATNTCRAALQKARGEA